MTPDELTSEPTKLSGLAGSLKNGARKGEPNHDGIRHVRFRGAVALDGERSQTP